MRFLEIYLIQFYLLFQTGNIFVYTGMLDMCANDDQLGIILGHEMSHAILNHSAETISHGNLFRYYQRTIKLIIIPRTWALNNIVSLTQEFHA